jgi:hypothetical protein
MIDRFDSLNRIIRDKDVVIQKLRAKITEIASKNS